FAAMLQAGSITFEGDDNFQKQSNRNRMYIYSANGLQLLNIPVKHSKNERLKYRDIRIEPAFNWQKQHFKSREAAYRTSPYFEFFEDDIRPVFEQIHTLLIDLNLQIHGIITACVGISLPYQKAEEYSKEV